MNWRSVSIFGERIARGKRRNGINAEITEALRAQRMNEMRMRPKGEASKREERIA
jgi:hypothetical protein